MEKENSSSVIELLHYKDPYHQYQKEHINYHRDIFMHYHFTKNLAK